MVEIRRCHALSWRVHGFSAPRSYSSSSEIESLRRQLEESKAEAAAAKLEATMQTNQALDDLTIEIEPLLLVKVISV